MGTVKSLFMQQLWMDTKLQHWWKRDRKQRETETTEEERHRLVVRWERAQVCWETKTPEEKRQRLADKKTYTDGGRKQRVEIRHSCDVQKRGSGRGLDRRQNG